MRCSIKNCFVAMMLFISASMLLSCLSFKLIFNRNNWPENNIELVYDEQLSSNYPREEFNFYSGKNRLQGYLYKSHQEKGIILMAHGIESGADSFLPVITFFIDEGFTVVTFDGTGTRDSEGEGIRGISQTRLDVLAGSSYIKQDDNLNNLPLFLYGHSMGGYAVLSALEQDSDVDAVIALAPFNSPLDTLKFQTMEKMGVLSHLLYPFLSLQHYLTFGEDFNVTAVEQINESNIPVMIVYGTQDDIIPHDKIGVFAYRDEIKNEKVEMVEIAEPYRNQHATMWLSQESAKYSLDIWKEYDKFKNKSDSDKIAFYDQIDKQKMSDLDNDLMKEMSLFLQSSLYQLKKE